MHLKFMSHNSAATSSIKTHNLLPFQLRNKIGDWLPLDIRLQSKKARHRLIEVKNPAMLIDDQYAVLDRVEQGLQERAFPSKALRHRLQSLRIQARYAV